MRVMVGILALVMWFALFLGAFHVVGAQNSPQGLNVAQACLSGGLQCDGMVLVVPEQGCLVLNNEGGCNEY